MDQNSIAARPGGVYSAIVTRPSPLEKRLSGLTRVCLVAVLLGIMPSAIGHPQDAAKTAGATRLTFDVASIHQAKPGELGGYIKPLPGGEAYTAKNIPVQLIMALMYKIPAHQIVNAPEWMHTDGYDIEAHADHAYNIDDLHTMFQNLLADRFNLKFHKEIREGNVYALTLDTPGSKMKVNDNVDPANIPVNGGPDGLHGVGVPMPYLTWTLSNILQRDERPVVDLTGLQHKYDFTLVFQQELPPDFPKDKLPPGFLDRPSIFDALKEQLGLKLTAQKGPVEVYVIDHVDRPTAN